MPSISRTVKKMSLVMFIMSSALVSLCSKINDDSLGPIPGRGITVLTLNDRNTCHVGDMLNITWEFDSTLVSGIQIDFSPNGGNNYFNIGLLQPAYPQFQDRKYSWVIPDSIGAGGSRRGTCSDSCRIFIHDYFDYSVGDISDQFFTIQSP